MSESSGVMRIGEVHAELRKDFPDIELSKIRYYEDKGLVQPSRSRKGYRLYSQQDVACLREAIRLANEEFVPLRVVRVRLIEQGLLSDQPVSTSTRRAAREAVARPVSIPVPRSPSAATAADGSRPVLSLVSGFESPASRTDLDAVDRTRGLEEFLSETGLHERVLAQLQTAGLITPRREGRRTVYSAADVRVADVASQLIDQGVDPRLLGSLRRVADRFVGVIDEITQPLRVRGASVTPEEARAVTSDVAARVGEIREILMTRAVEEYLNR